MTVLLSEESETCHDFNIKMTLVPINENRKKKKISVHRMQPETPSHFEDLVTFMVICVLMNDFSPYIRSNCKQKNLY